MRQPPGEPMPTITRREFVRLATQGLLVLSGLVGLGGLIRFLSYQPEPPPPRKFEIGPEKNYPLNSRTVLPEIPALLIRSTDGFYAVSLVCTHLGCTVQEQSSSLACPCHGSRFDDHGNVVKRPAASPLQALRVEVSEEGRVTVFG